ncbi:UvrD-helicase domain-containing protein [Inmirania thermothiophila]|uniref:ATP-dependent DNA helicase Rep n=1 Tax=Inmirania thermothiophila TaxID=1750597 RepID=A0A3N1Y6H2_9GAMM|nr:UvrD-helicase domain-containing protein [Inmirania thermothiophila]ROR34419.1 ATP-dependent DNA helicase Rep [Inmirania thermothiophila]
MELNPRQREAVTWIDGPLLVLAGAGSGKTRVIAHKIAHLLGPCGYAPRHVAAVTFTNKAAREMRERVAALTGGRGARGLTVCTFHSLGLEIIRRETEALGLRRAPTILDAADSLGVLREVAGPASPALVEAARARISAWKDDLVTPAEARARAASDEEARAAELYEAYQRHLRAYGAVDFDDLILLPVRLLEGDAAARERWQGRIRYLLVDEYQDTSGAQYRLVRALVGVRGALTVVGDDDQSIYAWRGARPDNLARLAEDFPGLKVVKLEQNYRSTGRILRAANRLISHNPHLFEKRLWSELGAGDPIRVLACRDEEDEALRVVSEIVTDRFRRGGRWRDYAILYRGNHQARPFERALREQGVPYFISGGTSFFERTEIRDLVAYLRLMVNPDDDPAFLRVVNTPRREIGARTVEALARYAGERGVGMLAACLELGLREHLPARAAERLEAFARMIVELGDRGERGDPAAAVRELVRAIDYRTWLEACCADGAAAERRWANVEELIAWIGRLAEEAGGEGRLAAVVERLVLMDILERDDEERGGDRVTLMTLHAAKGLEFPCVFLVGFEEGLLPHQNAVEAGTVEEERRLAYVGITRARRRLVLTWARKRRARGETVEREPSRFLDELPREELVLEGAGAVADPRERAARGRAHLANLKSLLGAG